MTAKTSKLYGGETMRFGSSSDEVTRLNMLLPKKTVDRLNTLKKETEASSSAEVVKNALRLYEAIVSDAKEGKEFCAIDKDGKITSYRLFVDGG
jgi:hypothetical protein